MNKSEFDQFAEEYEALHESVLAASGESTQFFAEYKVVDSAREVGKFHSQFRRLLDFGSGVGESAPFFLKYFPGWDLFGLDVSRKSVEIAKRQYGKKIEFKHFDGQIIPFKDNYYGLVFTACVFHHIPASQHLSLFHEIIRVLKPGGFFMIFEHNPFNWLTVRTVNACPFDKEAVLIKAHDCLNLTRLAGFTRAKLRYRIFFPHSLKWLRPIERSMFWVPLGAQYYVCAQKPAVKN